MKIVDFKATTVALPMEAPLRHSAAVHPGRCIRTILQVFTDEGIAQGDMHRPGQKGVLHRVATNTFILWTSWVNFLTTSKSDPDVHPRDMLDGALQSFLSFEPYLEPRFAAEVRAVFESHARK